MAILPVTVPVTMTGTAPLPNVAARCVFPQEFPDLGPALAAWAEDLFGMPHKPHWV